MWIFKASYFFSMGKTFTTKAVAPAAAADHVVQCLHHL